MHTTCTHYTRTIVQQSGGRTVSVVDEIRNNFYSFAFSLKKVSFMTCFADTHASRVTADMTESPTRPPFRVTLTELFPWRHTLDIQAAAE